MHRGLTTFTDDRKIVREVRVYHKDGKHSEQWADVVRFDTIEMPEGVGEITLMHPDGTRYAVMLTEEGLVVHMGGRHGGGMFVQQTSGNVVKVVNAHADYRRRLLNQPITES
jgi:hypothetical protein